MTIKQKSAIIVNNLTKCSTSKLIDLWNETEKQELSVDLATTRGWIMEALETKNPQAFDEWIDNCDKDDDLHHYFN
jgi:hypothetical protein